MSPREKHQKRRLKHFSTWRKHHSPVEALPFRLLVDTSVEEDVVALKWLKWLE